jgi:hypothetical protein
LPAAKQSAGEQPAAASVTSSPASRKSVQSRIQNLDEFRMSHARSWDKMLRLHPHLHFMSPSADKLILGLRVTVSHCRLWVVWHLSQKVIVQDSG